MFPCKWIIFLILISCIIPICNSFLSAIQLQSIFAMQFDGSTHCDTSNIGNECLEKEGSFSEAEIALRRKKAQEYLASLTANREDWIDPHDVLNSKGVDYKAKLAHSMKRIPSAIEEVNAPFPLVESVAWTKDDMQGYLSCYAANWIDPRDVLNLKSVDLVALREKKTQEYLSCLTANEDLQLKEMVELAKETKKKVLSMNDAYLTRWLKKFLAKIDQSDTNELSFIRFALDKNLFDTLREILKKEPLNIQPLNDMIEEMISDSVLSA